MNKKILIALILFLFSIIKPVYAYANNSELKTVAVMFAKFSAGVFISIIIIGLGLLIYSRLRGGYSRKSKKINDFQDCEIDDTSTIDDAINTFLNINKN